MREVKVLSELVGKMFGFNPEKPGPILVTAAVEVSAFCSQSFLERGNVAVIEYCRPADGEETIRFKTLFKHCGPDVFMASPPYQHLKMGKDRFRKFLQSSALGIIEDWGIDLFELTALAFQNSPVPVAATAVQA